jgi:hypothetical protein
VIRRASARTIGRNAPRVARGVFQRPEAPIQFCVGEADHRSDLLELATHALFEAEESCVRSLVDGSDSFRNQPDLLFQPLGNDIEIPAGFRSESKKGPSFCCTL